MIDVIEKWYIADGREFGKWSAGSGNMQFRPANGVAGMSFRGAKALHKNEATKNLVFRTRDLFQHEKRKSFVV